MISAVNEFSNDSLQCFQRETKVGRNQDALIPTLHKSLTSLTPVFRQSASNQGDFYKERVSFSAVMLNLSVFPLNFSAFLQAFPPLW